jgi:hypothetical protein
MFDPESETASGADRRKFLAACGKFAVVTPPAMTLLLSTSLASTAIAQSAGRGGYGGKGDNGGYGGDGGYPGGKNGNNGFGNGGGDGGKKEDTDR